MILVSLLNCRNNRNHLAAPTRTAWPAATTTHMLLMSARLQSSLLADAVAWEAGERHSSTLQPGSTLDLKKPCHLNNPSDLSERDPWHISYEVQARSKGAKVSLVQVMIICAQVAVFNSLLQRSSSFCVIVTMGRAPVAALNSMEMCLHAPSYQWLCNWCLRCCCCRLTLADQPPA